MQQVGGGGRQGGLPAWGKQGVWLTGRAQGRGCGPAGCVAAVRLLLSLRNGDAVLGKLGPILTQMQVVSGEGRWKAGWLHGCIRQVGCVGRWGVWDIQATATLLLSLLVVDREASWKRRGRH